VGASPSDIQQQCGYWKDDGSLIVSDFIRDLNAGDDTPGGTDEGGSVRHVDEPNHPTVQAQIWWMLYGFCPGTFTELPVTSLP
jgi:hypothetical protein